MSEIDKMNHTLERSISLIYCKRNLNKKFKYGHLKLREIIPSVEVLLEISLKLYFSIFLSNVKLCDIRKVNCLGGKKKRTTPAPSHFNFMIQTTEFSD